MGSGIPSFCQPRHQKYIYNTYNAARLFDAIALDHTTHDIAAFKNFKQGRGDVVREFVDAFRSRGLKVGFYYCAPGNYDDKFGNTLPPGKPSLHGMPPEAEGDYSGFMMKQFTELLTRYGPVDVMWIDQFINPYTFKQWRQMKAHIHSLQPKCLVIANNSHTAEDTDIYSYELPVLGPEKGVPPVGNTIASEVCDYLSPGYWFWRKDVSEKDLQSAAAIVAMVRKCNERRANYLLDVGPDASGLIPDYSVKRLKEIGALLNAESGNQ